MGLMLIRRDGVVKVRCRECGGLCAVPASSNGDAVCGKCVGEVGGAWVYRGDRRKDSARFAAIVGEAKKLIAQGRMA